ncbi:MAG TPA: hypothetical protein VEQ60_08940 [Longimicrobium sp.]|nr:hypothetical protein [Longimicrobium sp.]
MMDPVGRTLSNRARRPVAQARGTRHQTQLSAPQRELTARQVMEAGPGGSIVDSQQNIILNLADREFFFDMVVLQAGEGGADPVRLNPAEPLQPGRSYRVRVSASLNRYVRRETPGADWLLTQHEVRIQSALELMLYATADAVPAGDAAVISGQKGTLSLVVQKKWHYDFRLDVPADAPAATLVLELEYLEKGSSNLRRLGSRLVLEVAGQARPPAAPTPVYLPVGDAPPAHTAFLHVHPQGEDELLFQGWGGGPTGPALQVAAPRPRLPQGPPDPVAYPETLADCVYDYAQGPAREVVDWLDGMLRRHGDECVLVVVDYADSRLPWEMIRFGPEYLGARALVVRFAEVQHQKQALALRFGEVLAAGRAVAYVPPGEAAVGAAATKLGLDVERCDSPDDVQYALPSGGAGPAVGLVYVGSDEVLYYGDGDEEQVGRLAPSPPGQPCRVRFTYLPGPPDPRPVFFANAPFSALVPVCSQRPCGLAAAVLSQVAAAYVGTLGPVEGAYAAEVAERLWSAAAEGDGVNVPALLRRLRNEAVAGMGAPALSGKERKEAASRLRYAFMYVYYGSPGMRLRLSRRDQEGAA